MKINSKTLRTVLGTFWFLAGVGKLLFLNKVAAMLSMFVKTCLLSFYADFISSFVLANASIIVLLIAIAEVVAGIFILHSEIYAKLGLLLATLLNIVFLPLGIPQVFINTLFIAAQLWLMKKELNESIIAGFLLRFKNLFKGVER